MSTLIATRKFMLSDNTCISDTNMPKTSIVKHKITNDGKAIIGTIGIFCSQAQLYQQIDECYDRFKKYIANVDDDDCNARNHMDNDFVIIYNNELYKYVETECFELLNGDIIYGSGTGHDYAAALYTMGVPLKRIMGHVNVLDKFTSDTYNLTYTSSLIGDI